MLKFWDKQTKQIVDKLNNLHKNYMKQKNLKDACKWNKEFMKLFDEAIWLKKEYSFRKKGAKRSWYDLAKLKELFEEKREILIGLIVEPIRKELELL